MAEPYIRIKMDKESVTLTAENSGLYTFAGVDENGIDRSTRDHIFITQEKQVGEDGITRARGSYLFKLAMQEEIYNHLAGLMLQAEFPAQLWQRRVPDPDEKAYQQYTEAFAHAEVVPDFLPDDFS